MSTLSKVCTDRRRNRRWPAFGLALGLALLAALGPAQAADGPIRQRLKERWLERQQQEPAPQARTDIDAPLTQPGDHTFALQHGGLTRWYRVHVPATYDPARPAPLLVVLHGGGGSMDYMADDNRFGLVSAAEKEGAVVVFPNGYSRLPSGHFATWNAGACCGAARDQRVDDVDFIRRVVAQLGRQLNIDPRRIHATGMSNGAMMAYRLACEMPEVFTRIAAVAGTDNTLECRPARPVSVLHIHARDDDMVLFKGGAGPKSRDPALVADFRSVSDTVAQWMRLDGCTAGAPPQRVLERPGAWCERHAQGCRDGARVELCVTETGGHSWPGGHKGRGEEASQAISATELMWAFFKLDGQGR